MKFAEYISNHQVFTTEELMQAMDSPSAAEEQLRLATRKGTVERVRRGLLVSNYGRYEDANVDPYEIVAAADLEAVLVFHSALEAHGVAHNVGFFCQFRSDKVRSEFSFKGIKYIPFSQMKDVQVTMVRGNEGQRRATSKEQTIVDCLNSPFKAGGIEEMLRSVTTFSYVDVQELVTIAKRQNSSSLARLGWLLSVKAEDWRVPNEVLDELESQKGEGPFRLGRVLAGEATWLARWKLLLPAPAEEMKKWITRP